MSLPATLVCVWALLATGCYRGEAWHMCHSKTYGNYWCGRSTLQAVWQADSLPWLRLAANSYQPEDTAAISKLSTYRHTLQVQVFAATWCSDTRLLLPQIAAVLMQARIPLADVQVTLLNTRKKLPGHLLRPAGIHKVPTILLWQSDILLGRLVETLPPNQHLETALAALLAAKEK